MSNGPIRRSSKLTWEQVARLLAARMLNRAVCDQHPDDDPAGDCPACRDRTAYAAYAVKAGDSRAPRIYQPARPAPEPGGVDGRP